MGENFVFNIALLLSGNALGDLNKRDYQRFWIFITKKMKSSIKLEEIETETCFQNQTVFVYMFYLLRGYNSKSNTAIFGTFFGPQCK